MSQAVRTAHKAAYITTIDTPVFGVLADLIIASAEPRGAVAEVQHNH